jgi:hypothetical protein
MPTTADIQYERVGNFPRAWQMCADQLLLASRILQKEAAADESVSSLSTQVAPVGLMLRGMAVECLLKALWIKNGNKLTVNGRFLGIPRTGSHDLNQIAAEVGVKRNALEVDVLRRLTHFIEYGGRYPVPKRVEAMKLTESPLGGKSIATTWTTPSDNLVFDGVVSELERALAT